MSPKPPIFVDLHKVARVATKVVVEILKLGAVSVVDEFYHALALLMVTAMKRRRCVRCVRYVSGFRYSSDGGLRAYENDGRSRSQGAK